MEFRLSASIALVMMANTIRAQGLDGVFTPDFKKSHTVSFSSESFRFAGMLFDYHHSSCTESAHGHGTYTLRGDTLRLRFEALSPPGSVQDMSCVAGTSTPHFCFTVVDAATQQPERQLLIRTKNKAVSTLTNEAGEGMLVYTPLPNDSILVGDPGYYGTTVAITNARGQGYRIALAEQDKIRPGTVYTYHIEREGTSRLLIRRIDSNEKKLYRRLTARELKQDPW